MYSAWWIYPSDLRVLQCIQTVTMCCVVWRLLCKSMTHGYLLQFFLLLLTLLQCAHGSGFFELQVLEIQNYRGELLNGGCCGGSVRQLTTAKCSASCSTFFRMCLKEYQSNVTSTGPCSFGNTSSPVLGGSSFTLADPERGKLVLPFTFRWTRSFTLILQAVDHNNYSLPAYNAVIEEATFSGILLPSADWHTLNHHGKTARITYRVRVQCDLHYYNATCTKFCRPRDDKFGHYRCDGNGDKVCIPGWKGTNCENLVCKTGCHPVHGKCDRPGECECRPGWRGEFCDQCTPYPGCKHGYCNGSSWQCICDTNWGGILCDQDLNYCGTHEPCQNGGTCENTAPDQYLCTCPEGFSGVNCEVVDNPCAPAPCKNGGTCLEAPGGAFQCSCTPGWTGHTCTIDVDECSSAPCQNSGTCVDLENSFKCECTAAWQGSVCQFDADECLTDPCINANSCMNLVGDYRCKCQNGWAGKNCDQNINDCVGQCQHGATCIDLVNDYHCACQAGYTGRDCHTDIDDCESNPCKNGGDCVDQVNGYKCICPVGFSGSECQIEQDHCNPNPCENSAPCLTTENDYYCHCSGGWYGKNCSIPVYHCDSPPCDDTDECSSKPCQNNGTCSDMIADFACQCRDGWKGKTCTSRDSHCDRGTCKNGGTCQDLGTTYLCHCPAGFEGSACHIPKLQFCRSNPCQNGGTCINTGDYYNCVCRDGFKGTHCEDDVNDCNSHPCYNGGKCIDGANWFLCECAIGFTGPDCKININECASNPCGNGGTCLDGIGEFNCICSNGRSGKQCEVDDFAYLPGSCSYKGQLYENNSTWQDNCNICSCSLTITRCTNVWCGLGNCLGHSSMTCSPNQVCVPSPRETCITPPCPHWGECRNLESGRRVGLPSLPTPSSCWPNQAKLSNSCARLTLLLDRNKLGQGVSVEGLCGSLRKLLAQHESVRNNKNRLVLLCDLKLEYNDTIEVTLSGNDDVLEGIKILGEAISRKQTTLSALSSIVEVKVETVLVSDESQTNKYLIALICLMLIGASAATTAGVLYWRQRQRTLGLSGVNLATTDQCRHHDDEKSNNLQNEENLRRYANPLKDDVVGSMGSLNGTPGACAMDLSVPKVSVVRPLSALLPGEGNEMLEMISENDCPGTRKGLSLVAGTSSDPGLKPVHRNSQILLYKAQNPDVRKNTAAAFDDSSGHKDFTKSIINMSMLPVQRTNTQQSQQNTGNGVQGDVLTVLV